VSWFFGVLQLDWFGELKPNLLRSKTDRTGDSGAASSAGTRLAHVREDLGRELYKESARAARRTQDSACDSDSGLIQLHGLLAALCSTYDLRSSKLLAGAGGASWLMQQRAAIMLQQRLHMPQEV
jgi:hypothetical protein